MQTLKQLLTISGGLPPQAEGDRVVNEDRQRAMELYVEAKVALTSCQGIYRRLLQRAGDLITADKAAGGGIENGFQFHDFVLRLYSVCFDGSKIAHLEALFDSIQTDMSLDELDKLVDRGLWDTALTKLEAAVVVYSEDPARLRKADKLRQAIRLLKQQGQLIGAKEYDAATQQLRAVRAIIRELETLVPPTIHVPAFRDLRHGSEESIVLKRAQITGEADMTRATRAMERRLFQEALGLCEEARKSFSWVGRVQGEEGWEERTGISQLEGLIFKRKALAEGETLMIKARQELQAGAFVAALDLMHAAVAHYQEADADGKVAETNLLIADTRGQQVLTEAQELLKVDKFAQCLEALDRADGFFNSSRHTANCRLVGRLRARVQGQLSLTELPQAYESQDYNKALAIVEQAVIYFKQAGDERNALLREDPKERVRAVAQRDGERFKAEALTALTKKRDVQSAKRFLALASKSFDWAGVAPLQSGVKAVEKDVAAFEGKSACPSSI
jgi:tetratricopeptide (TPR) repeat protein